MLDLGCAVGAQSALLVERGARVIGIDGDAQLVEQARAAALPGVELHVGDLSSSESFDLPAVDGIWCSFTAAYFPALERFVADWSRLLKPGGWFALIEMDDLFAHAPLARESLELLEGFAAEAKATGRYDFRAGRALAPALRAQGFHDVEEHVVDDDELSFQGPAREDVLDAWRTRLARMKGLQAFAGERFEALRDDLLRCLSSDEHISSCRVLFALGRR